VVAPLAQGKPGREGIVTALCFGPVPSRRLGRSLGINNIPPKFCSYACVYCQVGRTAELVAERRAFFPPEEVVGEVEKRVRELRERGEPIDYLAFVPDGEPTRTCTSGRRSRPCEASAFPSR
jgi:wyosine [tRNA(Phe)-imidazoG37] synthetase (radical SAM superfamily)